MINSYERSRLEAAYSGPVDARAVLRRCVAGLLAIAMISFAAVATDDRDDHVVAGVSAPPVESGR